MTNGVTIETLSNQIKIAFTQRVLDSRDELLYPERFDKLIDDISRWLLNGDKYRNLLLYGGVGIGKTTCLRSVVDVLTNTKMFGYIAFFSANSMVSEQFVNSDGWRIATTYPLIFIDDIGTEQSDFKIYGTGITPIKTIIEERYLHKLPIVATTNLSFDEFGDRYGTRVMDRIKEYDVLKVNINQSLR